jgi:para-aminobenzoate synthetase/4-amino-4-deoxychorismate lyase
MSTTVSADPSLGIFETMLVLDGQPVELEGHLRRLAASLALLYGEAPPRRLDELVRERTTGLPVGRVRISALPAETGIEAEVAAAPVAPALLFPPPKQGPRLRSLTVPGGLGSHKWLDRAALATADGSTALLLDTTGEVLEAARANVFVLRDGALATPPTDGRILPGITRAAVIELAEGNGIDVSQRPVSVDELGDADAILLTGSVRGIEFARSLDGERLASAGEPAEPLRGALRARWGLA